MKNIILKISVLSLVAILITSCCKDDFETPADIIIPDTTTGIYVYVACADGNSISVVNSETLQEVASLTGADIQATSTEPRNPVISSDFKMVFVPCRHSNNVLVIDANTKTITHNVSDPSFDEPYAAAFTPGNGEVWVVNKKGGGSSTGSITIINSSTKAVTSSIQDINLSSPEGICIANGKAYIANRGNGTVSVFDISSHSFISNVDVGSEPRYAVSSKNGDYVYITDDWDGLAKINTTVDTVAAVIDADGRNASLSPDGSTLFVASHSTTIHMVSTATDQVTDFTIPGARFLYATAIRSDGKIGFATDEDDYLVYTFDPVTGALLNNGAGIAVGNTPRGIVSQ